MRHALAAIILLVSSTAVANPKAIEKTVKTSIVELAKLADNNALNFTSDALVLSPVGNKVDMASTDGCVSGAVANALYGCMQGSISHKPGAVISGTAGGVGWFLAPFTATFEGDNPEGGPAKPDKTNMRMGGIVTGGGKTWTIAAAMYVATISDKELLKGTSGTPASGAPKLSGDKKLAGVVAGWFTSGFAPNAAKNKPLIASGTSPSEMKSGSGAVTLVKSWDKLKLGATTVDAQLLADGKIGWVTAEVKLPRKSGKGAVTMTLAAIVVPDGDSWRWVSLLYQSFVIGGR
jgi:hypothetical protein